MATDPNDWMWAEAFAALERVEHMRRQFFRLGTPGIQLPTWEPPTDVFETDEGLLIEVALPGVDPHEIKIVIERDVLVISGIRHLPAVTRRAAIRRLEIPYGRFERQVGLPSGRFALGHPEFANGCLTIALTKR